MRTNKIVLMMGSVAALVALTGCSTPSAGLPPARLTFENYSPTMLNVQAASVVENYEIQNDPKDIAGQFVIAPSEAVKTYAARRFPASGMGSGRFIISIEDARVHLNEIDQQNRVLSWSGIGKEDQYRLLMRLRVTTLPDQVQASSSTMLKFERTLVMPASVPLAEREARQLAFLEKLIADIDVAIQRTLDQTPAIRQ